MTKKLFCYKNQYIDKFYTLGLTLLFLPNKFITFYKHKSYDVNWIVLKDYKVKNN